MKARPKWTLTLIGHSGSRAGGTLRATRCRSHTDIFERVLLRGGRLLTVGWGCVFKWERFMGRHSSALRPRWPSLLFEAGSLFSWAMPRHRYGLCAE